MRPLRLTVAALAMGLTTLGCTTAATPAPSASQTLLATKATPTPSASTTAAATVATGSDLYDERADARADIAAALAAAKADGKHVLLDFGADWCIDCHVLATYLQSPEGRRLVDSSFHVVSIDVGLWDHNVDVAATYGDPISNGIPGIVVLDRNGTVIGTSADGSLASASQMSQEQVLAYLARWAP